MRTQTLNDKTQASDPGKIRLSLEKLRSFHPELFEKRGLWQFLGAYPPKQQFWITRKTEHMLHGDSRAAVVMSLDPLAVAAFTDELDCVAMLRFPQNLVSQYRLETGMRLLTVNLYGSGGVLASDLENGPKAFHRYTNFSPMIAEFVSDDIVRIQNRKAEITETEWQRAAEFAELYLRKHGQRYRDGLPMKSNTPAVQVNII